MTDQTTGADDRVDKRRVTMRNVSLTANGETALQEAVDYVRPDHLEAYLADARSKWQFVDVSDEFDAGPGGYEGQTAVPQGLALPDAGVVYDAEGEAKTALDNTDADAEQRRSEEEAKAAENAKRYLQDLQDALTKNREA